MNYKTLIDVYENIKKTKLIFYIPIMVTIGILSLIIPFIYGTFDFSYFSIRILQIVKESIKVLFLIVFYIKYISPEFDCVLFMKYFIVSTCIYVGFTTLTIIFPQLRELIISHLKLSNNEIRLLAQENYFTRFGWCGFSGFTFTLKSTLSVIFSLYIIFVEQNKKIVLHIIFLIISFLGNLYYGRIGLVCSSIIIILGIIYLFTINIYLAKTILVYLLYTLLIFILFILFSKKLQLWISWAFQFLLNFFQSGSFSTSSTESLQNMYIIPNIKTLFIGDGFYSTSIGYYMNIDVGLLRPIYFGGILFQLLRYSTVVICLKHLYDKKMKHNQIFIFMVFILFVFFEIKGESIFPIISILFAVVCLFELSSRSDDYDD